jgi:hypothetical protein
MLNCANCPEKINSEEEEPYYLAGGKNYCLKCAPKLGVSRPEFRRPAIADKIEENLAVPVAQAEPKEVEALENLVVPVAQAEPKEGEVGNNGSAIIGLPAIADKIEENLAVPVAAQLEAVVVVQAEPAKAPKKTSKKSPALIEFPYENFYDDFIFSIK